MPLVRSFLSACSFTASASALALVLTASPVAAQSVALCASSATDADGDGWGWENNQTCVVAGSAAAQSVNAQPANTQSFNSNASAGRPVCSSSVSDADGDGWGWENNRSCIISASAPAQTSQSSNSADPFASFPTCQSGQNNGGWGFENGQSCRFRAGSAPAATSAPASNPSSATQASGGTPSCQSLASDPDGDGFGFENGRSCQVTSSTAPASAATSVLTPGDAPPPVAAAVPGFQNGHPICLTDASDAGNNGFGYENDRTCVVAQGVTATRNQPLLNQRSCIPWLEIGYGNYKLQNNVWNFGAVYDDNWSQSIELTGGPGNYVAKWDYNWLDRSRGDDFAVKSYPQVYYGRKTSFNMSGTVAETGLPVPTNNLPQYWVDFDYSETGVVERNVALESFFHTSCEAEDYNKQYEMMVWVGRPAIRTPGTLATTVTLGGRNWDVYTNPALSWAYVAFVAQEPFTSGTLNWNEFVYWSRDVGPSFGVPRMADNTCMGAIEIGTETFWGTGTFTLNRFSVNGR